MNEFAADPYDRLGHDIGQAAGCAPRIRPAARSFGSHPAPSSATLRQLEHQALEELAQLRAAKPVRQSITPVDPVASYINWDLAVDGLSLAD